MKKIITFWLFFVFTGIFSQLRYPTTTKIINDVVIL